MSTSPLFAPASPLDRFRLDVQVTIATGASSKLCAPSMIDTGSGSIVNVASMLGHAGSTPVKQARYCASKGAVVNLTRELVLQRARKGVRVNALCSRWFPSEMPEGMDIDEGSQRFIVSNSPIPRMGECHELEGPCCCCWPRRQERSSLVRASSSTVA